MTSIGEWMRDGYYGRGIAVGKKGSKVGFVYFVTGRSENSKNRVLKEKASGVYTEPFDKNRCTDPSLIIYRAVAFEKDRVVVTNGDHTDTVVKAGRGNFFDALSTRTYEPDEPIFTPRIAAEIDLITDSIRMAILKKGVDEECVRELFCYRDDGVGRLLTTYGGGKDVASFCGEPRTFLFPDTAEELAKEVWNNLDRAFRVAAYCCYIDRDADTVEKIIINEKGAK